MELTKLNELKLLGISEIAHLAKVSSSVIINWRKRDSTFPSPIAELKSGPIFEYGQIKKFLKRKKIPMATILSTINLKGGVGKTTITVALAEYLSAEKNQKVLVIDLDPQTSATILLINEEKWSELNSEEYTLARLFKDAINPDNSKFNLDKTLQKKVSKVRDVTKVDLLPSSLDLIDIQDRLFSAPVGRFYAQNATDILRRAIKPIIDDYDYILIDCPPNLGIITLNGLRISHGYLIPTIPDHLSTYGIPQIHKRVYEFGLDIAEEIKPLGILANMYRSNSTVHKNILSQLKRNSEPAPLFNTIIPVSNNISASADVTKDNDSYGTLKQKYGYGHSNFFSQLTNELIEKVENEVYA